MLADALADLKSRTNNRTLCRVANWANSLNEDEQDILESCMSDTNITSAELYRTLGKVPFGKTTLVDHRGGRCSCRI